jgi:hypothetical protein
LVYRRFDLTAKIRQVNHKMPEIADPPVEIVEENWLKPLSPKGKVLLETCKKKKLVLASGPRFSGKTISCLQCVCDHAWRVRRANITIITVSQSAGLDSGVWTDIVEIIPRFGLKWAKQPYVQAVSKRPALKVFNQFGQAVTIQLDSLKNEEEVEERFKNKRFSMMFVPELSNFRKAKTFAIWAESLRGIGVAEKDHLFLGDTNPSDEGVESWIYKNWYQLRMAEEYDPRLKAQKDQLALVEFDISDNIYSSPERLEELRSRYASDPDLYARYIEGKWVVASEDALFRKVFRPNFHVIGDPETPGNPEPEMLVPQTDCIELDSGWDMGSVNSANVIGDKYDEMRGNTPVTIFKALDELVVLDSDYDMGDYVRAVMEKRKYWEEFIGKPVMWNDWSDRSAFDMKEPISNLYHHQCVALESGGTIILQAATGGKRNHESVVQRISLLRRLLFENRLYISGTKCPNIIEMLKSIKKGRGALSVIQKESRHKHVFDALTYWLSSACLHELNQDAINSRRPKTTESGLVSVAY